MSVNTVFTALMNQVRRITGVSGTLTPEQATLALANANPADLSAVTATAQTVLTGYDFVDANGQVVPGSMTNRGAVSGTVTPSSSNQYTIPQGYHNGSGKVSASVQTKSILFEPDGTKQGFTPDAGKYLTTAYIYPCRMKTYTGTFVIDPQTDIDWNTQPYPTDKTIVIPANPVLKDYLPTQYTLAIFSDGAYTEIGANIMMGINTIRNADGTVTVYGDKTEAGQLALDIEDMQLTATVSNIAFVTTPVAGYKFDLHWNQPLCHPIVGNNGAHLRYILTAWESVPTDTPLAQGDPA